MKRSLRAPVAALAAVLALPGCFTVQHRYTGSKPMTNGPTLDHPTRVVRHFEAHDRQFFWLHGGVPVGEPLNGLDLAASEIGPHDGITNLRLRDGQNWLDIAVSHGLCLLTVVCGTWSTWVEGDVVDYSAPRISSSPAPAAPTAPDDFDLRATRDARPALPEETR